MNEEMAAKLAEAEANSQAAQIGPNHVVPATEPLWECCWESCDFQFEDMSDCIEHCVGSGPDPNGHVHTYFANVPSGTYTILFLKVLNLLLSLKFWLSSK